MNSLLSPLKLIWGWRLVMVALQRHALLHRPTRPSLIEFMTRKKMLTLNMSSGTHRRKKMLTLLHGALNMSSGTHRWRLLEPSPPLFHAMVLKNSNMMGSWCLNVPCGFVFWKHVWVLKGGRLWVPTGFVSFPPRVMPTWPWETLEVSGSPKGI